MPIGGLRFGLRGTPRILRSSPSICRTRSSRGRRTETSVQGVVFDIKRFAIHDGPGIRTSVFLKGCPLNCLWCQNPEGLSRGATLWYSSSQCIRCGDCLAVCPEKALSANPDSSRYIHIDRDLCTNCGACVRVCPSTALSFVGKKMEHGEVVEELLKDRTFYKSSGGGVTLTGGEPFAQVAFSRAILEEIRGYDIHTAVETCLLTDKKDIELLLPFVDLFLVDLKVFDPAEHIEYTGVSNDLIKENFLWLARSHGAVVVRIPIIPGFTDMEENLRAIGSYVAG
ncbi:MAG: glycyl-radical enzyme activating protein, partial [Spirochaetales bacterium]